MAPLANTPRTPRRRGSGAIKTVVAVAVVGAAGGSAAMLLIGEPDVELAAAGTAEFGIPQIESFEITTHTNGELEARDQIEIRSRLESVSTITEIIPEGSRVETGELLVRLNSDTIETQITEQDLRVVESRSELEAAETAEQIQLSENASKLRKAQSELTIKTLELDQWQNGDDEKRMEELKLAVENAGRNRTRLQRKYNELSELRERDFVSEDEWMQAEINLAEAQGRLTTARLELQVYETYQRQKDAEQKRLAVEEAEAELARVEKENEINLKRKRADVINRKRRLAIHEERLTELKEQLEACTIRAPSSGLVVYGTSTARESWRMQTEGSLQVGRNVRPNELLIVLPDTSEMIASVKVHESLAGRIRPGQRSQINIEAKNVMIPGTVESIGVLAESGGWRDPNRREYTVKISLDPAAAAQYELKPTLRCEAEIELGRVDDALAIPVQAIFNDGPVRFVYRPLGAKFVRTPVRVGRRSDTRAEIIAGLSAGEPVLLREPSPGEVLAGPWETAALEAAGYMVDEAGEPVSPPRAGFRGRQVSGAAKAGRPTAAPRGAPASRASGQRPATTQTASGGDAAGASQSDATAEN